VSSGSEDAPKSAIELRHSFCGSTEIDGLVSSCDSFSVLDSQSIGGSQPTPRAQCL
jgi:hypothetical protein